jgi:hypothetical protein
MAVAQLWLAVGALLYGLAAACPFTARAPGAQLLAFLSAGPMIGRLAIGQLS